MKQIDSFLNGITMYRLAYFGLGVLALVAIALGFAGVLPYSGFSLLLSVALLIAAGTIANAALARIFKAPANAESFAITALILFFILPPVESGFDTAILALAALIAMGSKYVIASHGKHIFNPAAFAAFAIGLGGLSGASWWVASSPLLIPTLILGLLIVRKTRRFHMLLPFLAAACASILVTAASQGQNIASLTAEIFVSWPLIFFGTVMLTEPLTSPPTKRLRIAYGIVAGIIIGIPYQFGPVFSTPETALILVNLFSYAVSSRRRFMMRLARIEQLSPAISDFVFTPDEKLLFAPGQYLEWTLPMSMRSVDSRGNRRYFTIASSPTEKKVRIGTKFPATPSAFKTALGNMNRGAIIAASGLAGDFTLPADPNRKMVWIAGGIGVTPFRSMAKYLTDTNSKRDTILYYASADPSDFVYRDVFADAEKAGLKTIYILSGAKNVPTDWTGRTGFITKEMIAADAPDYAKRTYYLSGPNAMVDAYKRLLASLGIPRSRIKTDYFPGF